MTQEEILALLEFYERMNHNLEGYRRELEQRQEAAAPVRKKEAVC